MIRETYKGRQLKAVKGKTYGKSRISVNGTACGEWLGTQADVIEWAKHTIDDVDSRPFEGRWSECWYAPGTYELNEIGHIAAPGGTCSCDLCKTEPWNSCQNITAGGVCVCHYCMKPYLADSTERPKKAAPEAEQSGEAATVESDAMDDSQTEERAGEATMQEPTKPRILRRNKGTNGYVTSDGRYKVEPVYGSSIRGGDVTRPTGWCLKDRQDEYEPRYRPLLADIRDILKERP